MAKVNCPSCKRPGTYSPKFKQCSACGLGYDKQPLSEKRVPVGPQSVTKPVTVTPKVTEGHVSAVMTPSSAWEGGPCQVCGCPGHDTPKTGAERQRAYRERQKS